MQRELCALCDVGVHAVGEGWTVLVQTGSLQRGAWGIYFLAVVFAETVVPTCPVPASGSAPVASTRIT